MAKQRSTNSNKKIFRLKYHHNFFLIDLLPFFVFYGESNNQNVSKKKFVGVKKNENQTSTKSQQTSRCEPDQSYVFQDKMMEKERIANQTNLPRPWSDKLTPYKSTREQNNETLWDEKKKQKETKIILLFWRAMQDKEKHD